LLQILALLQKVGNTDMEEMIEIKEEPSEAPVLEGVLGEGEFYFIQLCNFCDAGTQFL
jgi:23S rRNA A1618 N6-methylase RlmF